jgi:hypothetical protein
MDNTEADSINTWISVNGTNPAIKMDWNLSKNTSEFNGELEEASDKLKILLIMSVCDLASAMGKEIRGLNQKLVDLEKENRYLQTRVDVYDDHTINTYDGTAVNPNSSTFYYANRVTNTTDYKLPNQA